MKKYSVLGVLSIAGIIGLGLFGNSLAAAATTIFTDGFESGDTSAWETFTTNSRLESSNSYSNNGNFSVHSSTDIALLKKEFTEVSDGKVTAECWILAQNIENNAYVRCSLGSSFTSRPQQGEIGIGLWNGSIQAVGYNGSTWTIEILQEVTNGTWYKLGIEYDFSLSKAIFSVNGSDKYEYSVEFNTLSYIWIGDASSASGMGNTSIESVANNYYIDDISVTHSSSECTASDPASVAFEAELNAQYEAGKQYCIDNPEACGINTNNGYTEADLNEAKEQALQDGMNICKNDPVSCGINTESNVTEGCVTINQDLSLNVPCAEFGTNQFYFNLLPYQNPNNPFDTNFYWILDINSLGAK